MNLKYSNNNLCLLFTSSVSIRNGWMLIFYFNKLNHSPIPYFLFILQSFNTAYRTVNKYRGEGNEKCVQNQLVAPLNPF